MFTSDFEGVVYGHKVRFFQSKGFFGIGGFGWHYRIEEEKNGITQSFSSGPFDHPIDAMLDAEEFLRERCIWLKREYLPWDLQLEMIRDERERQNRT